MDQDFEGGDDVWDEGAKDFGKYHIFDLRHLFAVDLNINTLAAGPDHSKLPKSAI